MCKDLGWGQKPKHSQRLTVTGRMSVLLEWQTRERGLRDRGGRNETRRWGEGSLGDCKFPGSSGDA